MAEDPRAWCIALPLAFGTLASIRLGIPSAPYFDEVHYLPAARDLLAVFSGGEAPYVNREHPLLGKTLIATGIALLGDNPIGWRIMSLLAGMAALFFAMRAIWHASHDRYAVIAYGMLLATGFPLFVQSRIAMLDIFMVAFLALAAWQFAAAIREPERGRWRLALTGIAIGCALGSKWNAVPLAVVPGIVFFAARLSAGRRRLFTSKRGIPVPGIRLIEAFVWLGLVPLAVYAASYAPGYWLGGAQLGSSLSQHGLIALHGEIITLHEQVLEPHNYQSTWPQWLTNTRGIWYLYEHVDGAQRGVLLIGNPVTMLLGLPALLWCLVKGLTRTDWARIAAVVGFVVSLGLWWIAPKPVQFYYHYFVPSCFLLGALALTLSDIHAKVRWRWLSHVVLGLGLVMFAVFFKVLTAAPLDGPMSFSSWTWIAGWR